MVDDASHTLPADPAALARALPDRPHWLYARSLLLGGATSVRLNAVGDAALVLEPSTAVLLVVGQPDPKLPRTMLAPDLLGPPLLAHEDALEGLHAALPGWTARRFVVHTLEAPMSADISPPPGVVMSAPLDPALLAGLSEDLRADAVDAPAAAVRVIGGEPVAVCFVSDLTETLWDVGVDTIAPARRQGHAMAAFLALAAVMAAQGRQPVWAAYEDYLPSLALAARLGFRSVARMVELSPPLRPGNSRGFVHEPPTGRQRTTPAGGVGGGRRGSGSGGV